ncbi:hypothetical protein [Methanoplanus endosymbiosus]|uniref:Uncharacterized protein n=1 Tax=Methanoplanus endosymbiosus TaxID=33865 RepID=A0A9E7TLR5_9EURY|nr:hypothetical protein [Methanoplanus endosymbiosus]UUX92641.1 hypothetical protein L6E24_00500 [Methanoplanus endosymbiosus]
MNMPRIFFIRALADEGMYQLAGSVAGKKKKPAEINPIFQEDELQKW